MYNQHFRFSEAPFTIAPNPRYLYLSEQHREAIAHLQYGVKANGGFILLTGEVGTGKTTVCRCFLAQVPDDIQVAILLNPPLSETELLQAICAELKIEYVDGDNVNQLTVRLNDYLLRLHGEGRRAVLIVEEAQHLDRALLERLRLLTNLETDKAKLLQVILIGQPELLDNIAASGMAQLAQRVIARCHLRALSAHEIDAYLNHRLKIAGGSPDIFPQATRLLLFRLSKGVPRIINLICDRALLGCYVQGKTKIDIKTLSRAASEVFGEKKVLQRPATWWNRVAVATLGLALLVGGLSYLVDVWRLPIASTGEEQTTSAEAEVAATPSDAEVAAQAQDTATAAVEVASMQDLLAGDFGAWDAYRIVFEQWAVAPPPPGVTPCEYASLNQLDCWHVTTSLSALMQTNRPTVVELKGTNKIQYVALVSFDSSHIVLRAGEHTVRVSHDEFSAAWSGEHTVIWRRPADYDDALRIGYKGEMLPWLAARMARINDTPAREIKVYGPRTMRRIRNLQRECGLQVDGLVGRQTLIVINSLTDNVPLLSKSRRQLCGRKLS